MELAAFTAPEIKKKTGLSRLEKCLIALAVILGIISIAMIIAYAKYDDGVCKTQACVTAASRIITNMDSSVDPCQNFYQYSCGGWQKKNTIPENEVFYNTFNILSDEAEVVLKDALEKKSNDDIPAIQKAKTMYRSCINETAKNLRNGEPLIKILPDIYDWPVAMDNWERKYGSTWSAELSISHLMAKYVKDGIIKAFLFVDLKDTNAYILHIDQPGLGLPSRDYYDCTNATAAMCLAYVEDMVTLAKLIRKERNLSINETRIRAEMERVLELEKEIANAETPEEIRSNFNLIYNKMTISEVIKEFPIEMNGQVINWLDFMNAIIAPAGITIDENEQVVVYATDYLKKLSFLQKYTARELQNYLAWRFIISTRKDLGGEFKNAGDQVNKILYGTTTEGAVWRSCVSHLNKLLSDVFGRLYVKETFSEDSKAVIEDIISEIRKAFLETLEELKWMDTKTKQKAAIKASRIVEMIAFPEEIMNDDKLNQHYAELDFKEYEYFENKLNIFEFAQKQLTSRLRKKVDKKEWITGAADLNAFYAITNNQIVFPAGILQPPFFSSSQPRALNYGGIGTIIGHEITHGFDNKGSNFDENGELVNWWTSESMKNFIDLAQCFVYQYGNFSWDKAGGKHLNGIFTLSENIADNGGIREAYQAYKNDLKITGKQEKLPGLDFTSDQLFFIGFGQVWCGEYRPEYAVTSISTDFHSPGIFRVIGTLQNFPAFSEAFSCRSNDFMNPAHKCRVW
ncbi:neprilysin [Rhinophrynus dorsalis]